jgi:hypothetical protein
MARTYHAGEGGKRGVEAPVEKNGPEPAPLYAAVPMHVMVMVHVVQMMAEQMAMAPMRPECARRHQDQQQRTKYKLLHG